MSAPPFADRTDAGRQLGDEVHAHISRRAVTVLGIARGGIPVAAEVARRIAAPLEVLVVRKVGHPLQPELALGAVTSDGTFSASRAIGLLPDAREVDALTQRAVEEARAMETSLRGGIPPRDLTGETCIVVDDGAATGASMCAALRAVSARGALAAIAAVPVASSESIAVIGRYASEVMTVLVDDRHASVGAYYRDFSPVSAHEVNEIMSMWQQELAAR